MSMPQLPSDVQLLEELRKDYRDVRILSDGSIAALHDLLYTRAIMTGCTRYGFERRFCFQDKALAVQRFQELQSEDDVPEGHIARRGRS